ncbi:MFS transporter [Pseudonocardia sp. Cha107L01]|uniref:MFS transporter n=1 Tax=Pseudonocardia sp. Cha107L01 TaxID=3457576 RepID=UPI00403E911E
MPEAQRRVLAVLVVSQVLSGAGLVAGITVGALLVQQMLGSTSLAGLPAAMYTAGSALAALVVGRISQVHGRRPGLAAGYLAGALGSAGVVVAAVVSSPALLFISLFVYGAGAATNLQSRYAGADLAISARRGRAVATVLVATTLGGVVAPILTAPSGHLATGLGIPALGGPFLLSGAVYALAALVLIVWLRPDPLTLASSLAAKAGDDGPSPARLAPASARTWRAGFAIGVLTMILSQVVMIAVSTITPLEMHNHGHDTAAIGLAIAIHIAGMYLPSPVTGWLVDRCGPTKIAATSGVVFLASGIFAATAPSQSVAVQAIALALLGIAWNLGMVSGTALVAGTVPLATRAKTQGMVDLSIAIAGATGGAASGVAVAIAGYPAFALVGGIIALAIVPATVLSARIR